MRRFAHAALGRLKTGQMNKTEAAYHADLQLRQRFGCCVLLVHHSGHNMERARGSSALKAAVDAEYEITKDDAGGIKIRTTKMKDAELPPELLLRIKGVELPGLEGWRPRSAGRFCRLTTSHPAWGRAKRGR